MTVTLSSHHRAIDGAGAAEFLRDLAEAIREPTKWLGSVPFESMEGHSEMALALESKTPAYASPCPKK